MWVLFWICWIISCWERITVEILWRKKIGYVFSNWWGIWMWWKYLDKFKNVNWIVWMLYLLLVCVSWMMSYSPMLLIKIRFVLSNILKITLYWMYFEAKKSFKCRKPLLASFSNWPIRLRMIRYPKRHSAPTTHHSIQ